MKQLTRQQTGRLWMAGSLEALAFLIACGGGSSSNSVAPTAPEREDAVTIAAESAAEYAVESIEAPRSGSSPAAAEAPVESAFRFELPSASGATVSLDSYIGEKNVMLVFYRAFW